MSYDRARIVVNRILTRKVGIAGIPADVFIFTLAADLLLYLFLVQILNLQWQVFMLFAIVIDGTWIMLTLRGVWRFVGLIFQPPRYIRANVPYRSPLPTEENFTNQD